MRTRSISAITSLFIVICVLSGSLLAFVPAAVTASQESGYTFTTTESPFAATITGYTGSGGDITIPGVLGGHPTTAIAQNAFRSTSSLTSVVIPDTITSIGSSAFAYCDNLVSVTVPDNMTSLGLWAFSFCHSLRNIDVYSANPVFKSVDGVLYNKNMTTLIQCPGGRTGTFDIPNGVTSVESEAFAACASLTSVSIPETVQYLGGFSFANCFSLTSITIPSSVKEIGQGAFTYCTKLTSITIPGTVTFTGDGAFLRCTALTSAVIGEGVKNISGNEFNFCLSLTSVTIPESVRTIGIGAFQQCTSLTSITIPGNVTAIGDSAFVNCTSLNRINFLGDAPTVGIDWAKGTPGNITAYFTQGASGFSIPTWNGIHATSGVAEQPGDQLLLIISVLFIAVIIAVVAFMVVRGRGRNT